MIDQLCNIYRPAPEIQGPQELIDYHCSFTRKDIIPKIQINLSDF